MQIFNIGPLEFLFIILLALIILGPKEMVNVARKVGAWIHRLVRSQFWKDVMGTSREIRDLPARVVREAGLEEDLKAIRKAQNLAGMENPRASFAASSPPEAEQEEQQRGESI